MVMFGRSLCFLTPTGSNHFRVEGAGATYLTFAEAGTKASRIFYKAGAAPEVAMTKVAAEDQSYYVGM
jgi:hypothetical protein